MDISSAEAQQWEQAAQLARLDQRSLHKLLSDTSDNSVHCPDRSSQYHQCQVGGCHETLVTNYDKKSRVCSPHRKAHIVNLRGTPHRFCQKCSRFELLSQFDGDRKNCRQQLVEHNERQRRLRLLKKAQKEMLDIQTPLDYSIMSDESEPHTHVSYSSPNSPATAQTPVVPPVAALSHRTITKIIEEKMMEAVQAIFHTARTVTRPSNTPQQRNPAPTASPLTLPPAPFSTSSGTPSASGQLQQQVDSQKLTKQTPLELDEFLLLEENMMKFDSDGSNNIFYDFPTLT